MQNHQSILNSIQASYRGRIPSRADGKERRRAILDAVRRIIIKYGAQGVKHRAIAEEANVPLAATTYYFPDIQALLHDAFLDFCEQNLVQLQALESSSLALLSQFKSVASHSRPVKSSGQSQKTIDQALSEVIFQHIQSQVSNREDRIIERAFRNESIRNPELGLLVTQMERQQLTAISQFLTAIGLAEPDSDSREVMAMILFLEHSLLAESIGEKDAEKTLSRFLSRLLNS